MKNKKNETKELVVGKFRKFNENKFKTLEVLFLIILTSIISIIIGYLINNKKIEQVDESLQEIIDNYNYIMDEYYGEIDKKKIVSGAIEGMLSNLDDYSGLLDKNKNSSLYMSLEGSYNGIGVEIVNDDNNNIYVVGVLENSPAQKAGIQTGDIIKQVNDKSFLNVDIKELTNYIKNNSENDFELIIIRNGNEQVIKLSKTNVIIKSVLSKTFERNNHKIGYIYISIFSSNTAMQFKKALDELEKQDIDGLIIDVRDNRGGHLTTVASILSVLMDSDHVIYQIEKNNKKTKYNSFGKETKTYSVVVIQNKNSASASEILSSSLKESYGATIVGEISYGKGTVQELIKLSNGDSYKFTTKKWLTPNGEWINEKGVEPDVKIQLDDNYYQNPNDDTDNQLQEAIDVIAK